MLAETQRLALRLTAPRLVEDAGRAADWTVVGELRRVAERERLSEQLGRLQRPARVGGGDGVHLALRGLHGLELRAQLLVVGYVDPRELAQGGGALVGRARAVRMGRQVFLDGDEVRLRLSEQLCERDLPRVVLGERAAEGGGIGLHLLGVVLQSEPLARESGEQLVDCLESEDRRERGVERGELVEHRRELGVREERAEAHQGLVPSALAEHLGRGGASGRVGVGGAAFPRLLQGDRRVLAGHDELGGDARRLVGMQALPRARPVLRL